ncbi:D-alanyl-D-alanine carboxypeptidase [Actinomadura logoneensis]|uniref:D-alanyl-D-alanine carboxypeptidase n=1 Tax=Actinomadura logoneensis TaxID=2293572 RepID=A0A372JK48_9ACTN|nr:serine hydrolase [Actinomadura logoneensis]RFU40186.1 D-alanyl-D-alanine carboxypeptidase [Actinomadura logoneensis]
MRRTRLLAGTLLTLPLLAPPPAAAAPAPAPDTSAQAPALSGSAPSGIRAKAAYLSAGGTTWGRGAEARRPIASITKLMTAFLVVRAGDLDRTITIKRKYRAYGARHDASMAGLHPGDRLTARQLLYAMLLPSGSDAAFALVESYGGTWPKFVAKMNAAARSLGMADTRYDNFDGLPWPSGRADSSTPHDLVRLARAALADPTLRRVVATRSYTLPRTRSHAAYTWHNTNHLLGTYQGTRGIKTGFTNAAGYCLLFTARRGDRTVYGVVLGEPTSAARFTDAARLLDWSFGHHPFDTATLRLRFATPDQD